MIGTPTARILLFALALPFPMAAQQAAAPASEEPGTGPVPFKPDPPPADLTPRKVTVKGAPRPATDSVDAGGLKGIRVVSAREGEARVIVGGTETTLRPGDAIGGDVVKIVEAGRIVFERTAGEASGPGVVIVTFDAQGRGRVVVYGERSPVPPAASRVR